MPNISQSGRQGQLITPLGGDVLSLVGFDGVEGLSELFEYRIDALSEKDDIDFDSALGPQLRREIREVRDGPDRYFNGVLVEARAIGARENCSSISSSCAPGCGCCRVRPIAGSGTKRRRSTSSRRFFATAASPISRTPRRPVFPGWTIASNIARRIWISSRA